MDIHARMAAFSQKFKETLIEKINQGKLSLKVETVIAEKLIFKEFNGELRWLSTLVEKLDDKTLDELEDAWNYRL